MRGVEDDPGRSMIAPVRRRFEDDRSAAKASKMTARAFEVTTEGFENETDRQGASWPRGAARFGVETCGPGRGGVGRPAPSSESSAAGQKTVILPQDSKILVGGAKGADDRKTCGFERDEVGPRRRRTGFLGHHLKCDGLGSPSYMVSIGERRGRSGHAQIRAAKMPDDDARLRR